MSRDNHLELRVVQYFLRFRVQENYLKFKMCLQKKHSRGISTNYELNKETLSLFF